MKNSVTLSTAAEKSANKTNPKSSKTRKYIFRILIALSLGITSLVLTAHCPQTPKIAEHTAPLDSIGPIKEHYKELQELSAIPVTERSEMDAIEYPSKAYGWISALLRPAYLTKKQLEKMYTKLSFPANSSLQTKAELAFLLKLQRERTKEQAEEILRINDVLYIPTFKSGESDLFFICSEVMDSAITSAEYPNTKTLLNNIMKEARITEFRAKNHYMRARPWQLEPKLEPLKKIETPSFASGHTLWAYMQSYILAELIPTKHEEFINLAYDIGYSREMMGVHYPSDEEAARLLSYEIIKAIWATEKFQEDFKLAQAEWTDWN